MTFLRTLAIVGCFSIGSFATINSNNLTVGGQYLGLFNDFSKKDAQFDFAINLSFGYEIAPNLTGVAELQSSPGKGSLGFEGPETILTDLSLTHKLGSKNHLTSVTFGSFDTQFGHETRSLSNNANTFNNPFILNSLTYSALAGPVGTLNTLGIMVESNFNNMDVVASLSNGTSESATNKKKTFERLVQISSHSLVKGLRITGSYLASDDQHDDKDNSFATNLTATLIELNYQAWTHMAFKLKKAEFSFDDQAPSTTDKTLSHEAEINYTNDRLILALRGAFWRPQGTVASLDFRTVGLLSTKGAMDQIQLCMGYYLSKDTLLKTEIIHEIYGPKTKHPFFNTGIISGINVQF